MSSIRPATFRGIDWASPQAKSLFAWIDPHSGWAANPFALGSENYGRATSGTATWAARRGNLWMDFNGTTHSLRWSSIPIVTGASPRTIAFRMIADAFDTATNDLLIHASGVSTGTGTLFQLHLEDGAISVAFNGHRIITPKSALAAGSEYHVAVVVPNGATTTGQVIVYIDGALKATTNEAGSSQTLSTNAGTLALGSSNVPDAYCTASLRDVRLYRRGLSVSEIRDIYERPYDLWRKRPKRRGSQQAAAPPATGSPYYYQRRRRA